MDVGDATYQHLYRNPNYYTEVLKEELTKLHTKSTNTGTSDPKKYVHLPKAEKEKLTKLEGLKENDVQKMLDLAKVMTRLIKGKFEKGILNPKKN